MLDRIPSPRWRPIRSVTSPVRRLRLVAAASLSATVAAMCLVAITPGIALADCGTDGSGYTDNNAHPWYKKPPGCYDLNLTAGTNRTYGYDYYIGEYWNGNTWVSGSLGYVYFANRGTEGPDVPLLTSVKTGVPMFIVSYYTARDPVQVDY
jgi:hypothetical protein